MAGGITIAMLVRIWCAIALALGPAAAWADRPAPTRAQLDKARKAFEDGRKLHDAGKLTEAIEKFKTSYELSRNPLLLYNIGLTMEELGSGDLAVIFYRKFLVEAAPDAAQRPDVTDRIAAITRALAPPDVAPTPVPVPEAAKPEAAKPEPPSFGSADFTHRLVEAAPPGIPLDVTAFVSDGWSVAVTLFVRSAGEATFTATPMARRTQEWVGRIPAARMTGSAVQYYVEVRDQAGALLARSGKSTSPNVINIDASVAPKFYPDFVPAPAANDHRDGEVPIAAGTPVASGGPTGLDPGAAGGGVLDAGSRGFAVAKWSATAAAGTGVGLGITFYVLSHGHATALEHDSTNCGPPPCQQFDGYDRDLQRTGKLEQTISNVALIGGVAVAAVAGYFWYRELTASRRGGKGAGAPPSRASTTTASWRIAPALGGDGFTGAAAAGRF